MDTEAAAAAHPDRPISRVLLVGLMATGKSTVGRLVAQKLGWPYLDNDDLVRRAAGAALEDLRQRVGADGLHEAESTALRHALEAAPPVVAGAAAWVVVPRENRAAIVGSGAFVAWLRARPETLVRRIGDEADRPFLRPDPLAALRRMAADRNPLYAEISNLVVDVDDGDAASAASRITAEVDRRGRIRADAAQR